MPQNNVANPIYDTWDCIRQRISSTGIMMMPLAGIPPQPSIPIVMDGGSEIEIIIFVAGRLGAPPVIPAPTSQNSNRILLGGSQVAGFPLVGTGGYEYYRVAGCYVFAIPNPEGLAGQFNLGAAPMPGQPYAGNEYIPQENIRPGYVNDGQGQRLPPSSDTGPNLMRQITENW